MKRPTDFGTLEEAFEHLVTLIGPIPGARVYVPTDLDARTFAVWIEPSDANFAIVVDVPDYWEQGRVAKFEVTLASMGEEWDFSERTMGTFEWAEDCARFCRVALPQ